MFKKDMTPLSKGGQVHKHHGKGSAAAPLPSRHELSALTKPPSNSINDYAKATPLPQTPQDASTPNSTGLGSGSWAGNGM